MDGLSHFFDSAGFLPHGVCLLWRPDILALHAISDSLIALAYFSIPLAIIAFVRQRRDLIAEHRRIALLFSVFILSCGLTHVMGVVLLWRPLYVVDGLLKAFTALVSIITAVALWPVIPRLLALPSARQLTDANASLKVEIAAKLEALARLESLTAGLEVEVERRVREVDLLARRLRLATEGSTVMITEQDEQLRYVWLHNPAPPLDDSAIGLTDEDLLGPAATALTASKRQALETGQPVRTELVLEGVPSARCFDLRITPTDVAGGARGLLVAAIDITEQRRQHIHLQTIMHELAHRAKNLLSLVEGIARQTAKAEGMGEPFIRRFGARLAALGSAHDLLISRDWKGVDLAVLIKAQLAFILPETDGRVTMNGPDMTVSPQIGQYLALAIHELATNAIKHGVLKDTGGSLSITWALIEGGEGRAALIWTPNRKGFGRMLLETLVPRAVGGESELTFTPQGVVWRVTFTPAIESIRSDKNGFPSEAYTSPR